ncbi:MAG: Lecithin:cholesterol acyltransferase [Acidobacteria bacterium OLB17]|nr:MAG: Lecithin:cholesterol acyltransferase [Acidobacteria bacterium OLB17]MCZ2390123.1 hypothetical protein [Acidobacteriota bacterium]
MMRFIYRRSLRVVLLLLFVQAAGSAALAAERNPVVIIPGVTGSELVNPKAKKELVWPSISRSKTDDIRLPITEHPLESRDGLVAGDVIRSLKIGVFPRIDIYQGLIDALTDRGGYHEENWEAPTGAGGEAAIYVFPYDWRLDNVHNARLLVRKLEALKAVLKKPELKFDVIAHSMGGLITRYAAMYGDADLPAAGRKPTPTWAGEKLFGKIVLLGTPNEGSPITLAGFVRGESFGPVDVNLPFVRNVSRFDIFAIPAAYELLPAPGTFRLFDADLNEIEVDLYDPRVWKEYGWDPIEDPKFRSEFSPAERKAAPVFFAKMLARAKLFHEALAARSNAKVTAEFDLVGSECRATVDAAVVSRNGKSGGWTTLFNVDEIRKANGKALGADELRAAIYTPGDGVVTAISFQAKGELSTEPASTKFVCESHSRLPGNAEIQDHIIDVLRGVTLEKRGETDGKGR